VVTRSATRQETPGEQATSCSGGNPKVPSAQWIRRFRRIARLRRPARGLARLHAHTLVRVREQLTGSHARKSRWVGKCKWWSADVQGQGSRVRRREAARTGLEAGRRLPTRSIRFLVFRFRSHPAWRVARSFASSTPCARHRGAVVLRGCGRTFAVAGGEGARAPSPHGFGRRRVGQRAPSGRR
jgi:hypothetical protein